MKKIISLSLIALLSVQLSSCKKEESKKDTPKQKEITTSKFSLSKSENTIEFTAYKTTEKVPVKGMFKKVVITNKCEGNTIKDAVNGAEFKIPISSLETNNSSRNYKIQKFFFQIMENTIDLSGKFVLTDDKSGIVNLTMNGMTKELPFEYTIKDNTFSMESVMDINNWNAQKALSSLNEVCKDLHKGSDGVSKTWNEVAIKVNAIF